MRERKIVVPEGMLKAAVQAFGIRDGYEIYAVGTCQRADAILEAALGWLSENPIVPTAEQVLELKRELYSDKADPASWFGPDDARRGAVEWQRRMFLAPEPELSPAAQRILSAAQGSTFTPEEYKAIEHSVRTATHGLIDAAKEAR